jgi:methionine-rich copper-binding protein CopC
MKPMISKAVGPALLLAAASLLTVSSAQAHAHLLKSLPAADAAVGPSQNIRLQFSEALEPKFSGVELKTAGGAAVELTSKVAIKDRKTLDAAPKAPLAPGAYRVLWHVVSADGHKMTGDYGFTVK